MSLLCFGVALVFAAPLAAQGPGGLTLVLTDETPDVTVPAGAIVASIRFAPSLTKAVTVAAPRLRFAVGAEVVYPRNATVANQALTGALEVDAGVTFRNDNGWTHEAHMLRVDATLVGGGTVRVEGAADGGVELRGDSRATFHGALHVRSGMLIVRAPRALGPATVPIRLSGGKLFLPGVTLSNPLVVDGDATIWLGGDSTLAGSITIVAGATLTLDSGGGNRVRLAGRVSGAGTLRTRGAAQVTTPIDLGADSRVAATVGVWLVGPDRVAIAPGGHDVSLGLPSIQTDTVIRCAAGKDVLRFPAAAYVPWTGTLVVEGFDAAEDRIVFGADRSALSAAQLARVGFRDPVGEAPGLRHARLDAGGVLVPAARVVPRGELPFAIDAIAEEERRVRYEVAGLSVLAGPATPLHAGDTLVFFGDSITWLGGFAGRIERSVAALGVRVRNRGINGGGVRDLRDGAGRAARAGGLTSGDGDAPQAPFAEVLRDDQATVAVVLIGINDVNWRGTTDAEFEAALRALCRAAAAASARCVLATLLLGGELPDRTNPRDAHIDRVAALTRRVASDEGATLVDLRAAAIAWLQNHNRRLRLDGTFAHEQKGLLTYDGIHLSERGNDLVAELLADGIARTLRAR